MPIIIAGKWYESAAFWSAAGATATLVAGFAAAIVALVVAFPRRRLIYGTPIIASLLTSASSSRGDLELRHRGTAVTEPYVVDVEIISRSRRDITREDYDNQEPIRLDIGTRILELLKATSEPRSLYPPTATVDGSAINIGPSLIGKRQKITYTILVDGRPPGVNLKHSVNGLQVLRQLDDKPRRRISRGQIVAVIFLEIIALSAAVGWLQTRIGQSRTQVILQAVGLVGAISALVYIAAYELRRYRRRRE
jgi:hypothetical protein